MKQRLKKLIND